MLNEGLFKGLEIAEPVTRCEREPGRSRILDGALYPIGRGITKTGQALHLNDSDYQYTYFDFLLGGQVNCAWILVQNGVQSNSHR